MVRHSFLVAAGRGTQSLVMRGYQDDGSAEEQADVELQLELLQQQGQLHDPRDPVPHRVSRQWLQLPSIAAPEHMRTVNR